MVQPLKAARSREVDVSNRGERDSYLPPAIRVGGLPDLDPGRSILIVAPQDFLRRDGGRRLGGWAGSKKLDELPSAFDYAGNPDGRAKQRVIRPGHAWSCRLRDSHRGTIAATRVLLRRGQRSETSSPRSGGRRRHGGDRLPWVFGCDGPARRPNSTYSAERTWPCRT